MAITAAVDNGMGYVLVYDDRGAIAFSVPGKVVGWTGSTVSVDTGPSINVYNENGSNVSYIAKSFNDGERW